MTFEEYYELIELAKNLFYVEFAKKIDCPINLHLEIEDYKKSKHYKKNNFIPYYLSAYDYKEKEINIFAFNFPKGMPNNSKKLAILGSLFQSFYHYITSTLNEQFFDLKEYYKNKENISFEFKEADKLSFKMFNSHLKNIESILKIKEKIKLINLPNTWFIETESGYDIYSMV